MKCERARSRCRVVSPLLSSPAPTPPFLPSLPRDCRVGSRRVSRGAHTHCLLMPTNGLEHTLIPLLVDSCPHSNPDHTAEAGPVGERKVWADDPPFLPPSLLPLFPFVFHFWAYERNAPRGVGADDTIFFTIKPYLCVSSHERASYVLHVNLPLCTLASALLPHSRPPRCCLP